MAREPNLLDAIDGFRNLVGSVLFICIGIALIVYRNLIGRIVGLVVLSPWIYWAAVR